jgi:hypothetical protein
MGYWKEKQIRDEENGFHSGNKETVCFNHFDDYGMRKFISGSATKMTCSYCKRKTKTAFAVPLDDILSFVAAVLHTHYESPVESLPYDSSEGGYQYPEDQMWGTRELVTDIIGLEVDKEELLDDICSNIVNDHWCQRDPFMLTEDRELMFDWEYFSQLVKHKVRYVFFKANLKPIDEYSDDPVTILNKIGEAISKLKLLREIDFSDQALFRARQHGHKVTIKTYFEIGPPPETKAGTNRFSPAGIPMFYAGEDEITAIAEIIDRGKPDEVITVGTFYNTAPLTIIDLTKIPDVSIFDEENSSLYYSTLFLKRFADVISVRIDKNGSSEHIEYVPTQIVTEYFRYMLSAELKTKIHGIKYRSAAYAGGICFVLFLTIEDCAESDFEEDKKSLMLDQGSLERIRVGDLPVD